MGWHKIKYSFFRKIYSFFRRRFQRLIEPLKYSGESGYHAEKYWTDRLTGNAMTLRGVGRKDLTEEENEIMYLKAKETFLTVCEMAQVDFAHTNLLDIGCGNGYYASVFLDRGGESYTGIDITDALFEQLRDVYSNCQFVKLDVSTQPIKGHFDLIIMIDVAQHITNDEKFSYAMQNIQKHLKDEGVFIVTADLSDGKRDSFYERSKSMEQFRKEFPECSFSDPIPFRDKYIFFIRKGVKQ